MATTILRCMLNLLLLFLAVDGVTAEEPLKQTESKDQDRVTTKQSVSLGNDGNKAKARRAARGGSALAAKSKNPELSEIEQRLKPEKPMSAEEIAAMVEKVKASEPPKIWDIEKLSAPPAVYPAPEYDKDGVKAIFFENEPGQGKPSRVFAYYGIPAGTSGQSVPGIVLVHGGGGTAFDEWVRLWNKRGYAAIAIDWNGTLPVGNHPNRPRHEWAGPTSQNNCSFGQLDQPITDQWAYHAVAAVIRAHSLLRSLPGIDPDRIGLTGISWGGYLTSIVAGVDHRFMFAIPVYGCGFLPVSSSMKINQLAKLAEAQKKFWLEHWEPSLYLKQATLPMLWINGTNDLHYHMPAFALSAAMAPGTVGRAIRVKMKHSHIDGWAPEEIYAFADAQCKGGAPLIRVTGTSRTGNMVSVNCNPAMPAVKAELVYTLGDGFWPIREWMTMEAKLDETGTHAEVALPGGAKCWFFNLTDRRGLISSSAMQELHD